jgi:hypothetical protein
MLFTVFSKYCQAPGESKDPANRGALTRCGKLSKRVIAALMENSSMPCAPPEFIAGRHAPRASRTASRSFSSPWQKPPSSVDSALAAVAVHAPRIRTTRVLKLSRAFAVKSNRASSRMGTPAAVKIA